MSFGQYLLGATTPDIRVITRQARFSTHYFDLNETGHQDSVAAFFRAQEPLSDAGAVERGDAGVRRRLPEPPRDG